MLRTLCLPVLAAGAAAGLAAPTAAAWQSGPAAAAPSLVDAGEPTAAADEGITLNARGESLGSVLEAISVQRRINIVAATDTNVPVTANFYDASLEQALDWILTPLGLAWHYDGRVYSVLPRADHEALTQPLVHHVFRPNYLSASELERMLTQFLTPRGRIVVSQEPEVGIPSSGDTAGGLNTSQPETIVVIDTKPAIERMTALVDQLDERPRQVLVEATILEVTLDETNRFGMDIAFIGGSEFGDFESLGAAGQVYSAPTQVVPGDLPGGLAAGAPFLNNPGTSSFNQGGFTENDGEGLRIGYVGQNAAFFLEALQRVADTNVLANTKVLALNKMRGELIIGGRLGYFGGTTVSDGISQQTVEFLEVGTQLRFRPFISNDGFVRLEIHPQRSSGVVDTTTGLPTESTSEVTTNVMVRDGETVVIGGLIESRDVQTTRRVPFLGYLPLIGWMFSSESSEVKRTEIIVLLTPKVLENGERAEDAEHEVDLARARRATFREGFGPIARVEQARRYFEDARSALGSGDLNGARRLCDRGLLLDPLAQGAMELSQEIDASLAEHEAQRREAVLQAD